MIELRWQITAVAPVDCEETERPKKRLTASLWIWMIAMAVASLIPLLEAVRMFFFKMALITCAFYLAIVAFLDLALFLAFYFGRLGMFAIRGWPLFVLFGIIWLISFWAAGRIEMAQLRAKFPH